MATQEDKQRFLAKVRAYDRNPSKRLAIEIYDGFLNPTTAREGFILIPASELAGITNQVAAYRGMLEARDDAFAGKGVLGRIERARTAADFKAVSGIFEPAVRLVERMGFLPARPHPMQAQPADPAVVDQVRARLRGLDAMALMSRSIALRFEEDKRRAIDRLDEYFHRYQMACPNGLSTAHLADTMVEKLGQSRLTVNFNARRFFQLSSDQIGTSYKNVWETPAEKSDKYLADRDKVESGLRPFGAPRAWPTPTLMARWVPDAQAKTCQQPGCTATLRMLNRHHCRLCGKLFCSAHSTHTLSIKNPLGPKGAGAGVQHDQRVCDGCFAQHREDARPGPPLSGEAAIRSEIEHYATRGATSFQAGMRPRYAALDFLNARCGGATFYGRSFFVFHRGLIANATLTHTDTFDKSKMPQEGWHSVMATLDNMYPLVAYMEDEMLGKLVIAALEQDVDCMSAGGTYSYLESQIQTEGVFGRDITEVHISEAELSMVRGPVAEHSQEGEDQIFADLALAGTAADVRRKAQAFAERFGMRIVFVDDTAYPLTMLENDRLLPAQPAYHHR